MTQRDESDVIRRSVQRELGQVEDNLYRYQLQARHSPDYHTGNGEPITDVIMKLEAERDALRRALESVR